MAFPISDATQGELLDRLAAETPDADALIYPDRGLRWSFADLAREADEVARGLIALGLRHGDHVAVWSDNRPVWIPLAYALAKVGCVLVTVNVALVTDEVGYVLRQSRSRAVIAPPGLKEDEYHASLTQLRADGSCPDLEHCIALDTEPAALPEGFVRLEDVLSAGASVTVEDVRERTRAVHLDDPANIQYTSGTTGFPKGVVLTHGNVVANGASVAKRMELTAEDRVLLQVPLFHCFGCVIALLGGHTTGAALIALQRFDPLRALEAIDAERCTVIHGVPTMYLALLEHEERARFETGSLRVGAMGGSMCPPDLMRRVAGDLGCAGIANAYGLTECSPAVAISGPDVPLEERILRAGTPIDGVTVRVVDPATGEDRAADEEGEVWVHGPNVMQGYFDKPEETAAALTDDRWLRTGDLGTLDATGSVAITGRLKDLIIRGGENVMPAEVEDALRTHPRVRDAAVFGVPDERLGEVVHAAIVLRDEEAPGVIGDELAEHVASQLATYKRPTAIHVVDAFPLTPSGKVRKFVLRERFSPA